MTKNLSQDWLDALAAAGIRTAYLFRLEFKSGTLLATTAETALPVSGTGDPLLDGNTFSPFDDGNVLKLGGNAFSYDGSDSFNASLALSATAADELKLATIDATEYQGRLAYVWRAVQLIPATESSPGGWGFKLIRSGFIDTLATTSDRDSEIVRITIEANAAYTSKANGRLYQDQATFWPGDRGGVFIVPIANGNPESALQTSSAGQSFALDWVRRLQ